MATIPGWTITKTLGEGGQGNVHLVTRDADSDGQKFALKKLRKTDKAGQPYQRFCREIDALKALDHPAIIKLVEHSSADSDGPHFYVMEYIEGAKSLSKLLGSGDNPFKHDGIKATRMFIEILTGLEACEAHNIIHRDLSPANILVLPDGHIKIIDFGLCDIVGHQVVTLADENFGTVNYRAPECSPHSETPFSISTDLYSAAKILWSAITDRTVFEREEPVFKTLSMSKCFPDYPNRWHIQRIFEKTIRKNRPDRWQSATQARVLSERICQMVEQRLIPVEQLLEKCPICRWGDLVIPDKVFTSGNSYGLFSQDNPGGTTKRVCNHCGHCFLIAFELLKQTIASGENLT